MAIDHNPGVGAKLAAPLCDANEKGHATPLRRRAMTSILKRFPRLLVGTVSN
jgi:hypothetical protein